MAGPSPVAGPSAEANGGEEKSRLSHDVVRLSPISPIQPLSALSGGASERLLKQPRRLSAVTPGLDDVESIKGMAYEGQLVHKQGALYKEGKTLMRRWQPRWVVLTDSCLFYWASHTDYQGGRPHKKEIKLSDCSICTAEEHTKKPFSFGVFHPQRRDYFFIAQDDRQLLEWVHAIEKVLGVVSGSVTLSDFDCLTLVGKGAYGKVIQARKKDTGTVYAMKVLNKDDVLKTNQVQSTRTERRVLEVINHPFIVKLHYAFQTNDKLCLVMDFINGGELFTYMSKERKFSEERSRFYASEIILALQYIHSMDIIYRDLKPENIMIDRLGHIRLTDFGLSKDAINTQKTYSMVGSPYYMAPEIILKQGHGKAVDWWSLGILIYEMLTGTLPFFNENTRLAYKKLLTEELEFPPNVDLSPVSVDLLVKMLARNPQERLGSDVICGGASFDGVENIKQHAWFGGVDFDKVLAMEVPPPFAPKVKGIMDVSHFSSTFTEERLIVSGEKGGLMGPEFEDWTGEEGGGAARRLSGGGSRPAGRQLEAGRVPEMKRMNSLGRASPKGRDPSSGKGDKSGRDRAQAVCARATSFLEYGQWDLDAAMQALVTAILNREGVEDLEREKEEEAADDELRVPAAPGSRESSGRERGGEREGGGGLAMLREFRAALKSRVEMDGNLRERQHSDLSQRSQSDASQGRASISSSVAAEAHMFEGF